MEYQNLPPVLTETLNISDPISIQDFIERWQHILPKKEIFTLTDTDCLAYNTVTEKMQANLIPTDLLEELFIVCNPIESLYPPGVKPNTLPLVSDIPDEADLLTVKNTKAHVKKKNDPRYAYYMSITSKYSTKEDEYLAHNKAASISEKKEEQKHAHEMKKGKLLQHYPLKFEQPEVILTVSIMKPNVSFKKRGKQLALLHVLGANTLADLRDSIHCVRDSDIPGDFSENPDFSRDAPCAKELYPSSMLFIEDTFYVDKRIHNHKDYSKEILSWLKSNGDDKTYDVKDMFTQEVKELVIRLGQPYVYIHQGGCEHIVQFTDLRLVHEQDCQYQNAYPIIITETQQRNLTCNACQSRGVKWMVRNSTFSPNDPDHYCDVCLKMLHYDKDGTKLCNFQAYVYSDPQHQE